MSNTTGPCQALNGPNIGLLKAAKAFIKERETLSGCFLNYSDFGVHPDFGSDPTKDNYNPNWRMYWKWSDGMRDYDLKIDGRWDINCAGVVRQGLFRVGCTRLPYAMTRHPRNPIIFEDYKRDPLYPKVEIDKAGPGDMYFLRYDKGTPNDPSDDTFHTGFIDEGDRELATVKWWDGTTKQAWKYNIFHSEHEGAGPVGKGVGYTGEPDQLYIPLDGKGASIIATLVEDDYATGTIKISHKQEWWTESWLMRPKYLCRSDCMKDRTPPPLASGINGPPVRHDPLLLDLTGTGIQTLGVDTGIHFDHDGNGFMERTGWADLGTGVLM